MLGRGRLRNNVCIKRLWRSIKYEESYLFKRATIAEFSSSVVELSGLPD